MTDSTRITDEEVWAFMEQYPDPKEELTDFDNPGDIPMETQPVVIATAEEVAQASVLMKNSKTNMALDAALEIIRAMKAGELNSKPAWKSKILGMVAAGISGILITRFGLDISQETLINLFTGGGISMLTVIGIMRKWFTTKVLG